MCKISKIIGKMSCLFGEMDYIRYLCKQNVQRYTFNMEIIDNNLLLYDDCPHLGRDFILYDSRHQTIGKVGKAFLSKEYVVVTIVEAGEIDINVNDVFQCRIRTKGMMYQLPEQVCSLEYVSDDYRAKYIIMSNNYIARLGLNVPLETGWHFLQQPFVELDEQTVEAMQTMYNMCANILRQADNPSRSDIIRHLISAFYLSLDFYYHSKCPPVALSDREHTLTQQFFDLLRQHGNKEHSVQFYADRLYITPKYLSTCVKQATGQNAKQCIDNQRIRYVKYLLCNNSVPRTVTQVAYELGFPDLATFSRYFTRQTGIRPKAWREQTIG